MKVYEAIENIKNLKPSQYSDEQLIAWLSELDGTVWAGLLSRYTKDPAPALPYSDKRDMGRELLIPFPYDGVYMHWLGANIDYMNGETERYTNGMMMYNAKLQEFYNDYSRNHRVINPVFIKGVKA